MHTGRKTKNSLFIILAATLLASFMFTTATVYADDEKTITGLGTGTIVNPETGNWDKVYFGTYDNTPVMYRVLDKSTTTFTDNDKPTMFLDCENVLLEKKFDDREPNDFSNAWLSSTLRTYLNTEDGFYGGSFSDTEKNAVASSTVEQENYTKLQNDRIFLLDYEDVIDAYGYPSGIDKVKNREKYKRDNAYSDWMLRSPYKASEENLYVWDVGPEGDIRKSGMVYTQDRGVSPALNVDLKSVIFSSLIKGFAGEPGAEYKLTIKDPNMTIKKTEGSDIILNEDYTVTVPYTISGDNAGEATRVSVLIMKDPYKEGTASKNGYEYLKLAVDKIGTSGTGTFTLPVDYRELKSGTDYHVYILAEDVNKGTDTDYASAPKEIKLPGKRYTVTFDPAGGTVSRTTALTGEDGKLPSLPRPERKGYDFIGWFTNSGAKVTTDTVFTESMTVHAYWEAEYGKRYTVTFDPAGGTVSQKTALTGEDGKLPSLPVPERKGYDFTGWFTSDGTKVTTDMVFTDNMTVYADWKEVKYSVEVITDGHGTAKASKYLGKTGTIVKITASPKSGYEFMEWDVISGKVKIADKTKASTTFTIKTSDVIVQALFVKIPNNSLKRAKVTLSKTSFTYNGKTIKPKVRSVKIGNKSLKEKTDYTVVYPSSSKNVGTYKVKIKSKGKYIDSKSVSYEITKAANPMKVSLKKKELTVKRSKLKTKAQSISLDTYLSVSGNRGKVTYKKTRGDDSITVDSKTGKIKIRKGLKKGTYKVTISAKAAGSKNYKPSAAKKVDVKIVVK